MARRLLLAVAGLALAALVAFALLVLTARRQATANELQDVSVVIDSATFFGPFPLEFDLTTARLVLLPVAAGEPLRVDSRHDPAFYRFVHDGLETRDGNHGLRLELKPRGTTVMAVLRMKLGSPPPLLRVQVPADLPLEVRGIVEGGHAALELGGLDLRDFDLHTRDGATTVSLREPTRQPVDGLLLSGSRSSLEVTGVGYGSPAVFQVVQRLGEIDLDLRGPWQRSASVLIHATAAGGTLWLPQDVAVFGLGDSAPLVATPETPRPELNFEIEAPNLVVIR